MGNEAYGDIRTMSPEEHWTHFEKSWVALQSYTYLGKGTPFLDIGVERETDAAASRHAQLAPAG